jgi:hypothetical protein
MWTKWLHLYTLLSSSIWLIATLTASSVLMGQNFSLRQVLTWVDGLQSAKQGTGANTAMSAYLRSAPWPCC